MIVLFIHQNYPGQYLHLATHLGSLPGHRVLFLTQQRGPEIRGVEQVIYRPEPSSVLGCHEYTQVHEAAVRTGLSVLAACRRLSLAGVVPDLVIGHSGWGETLLVKEAFPDTPLLAYFEYYYQAQGADIGFDPEFNPARADDGERLWLRNSTNLLSLSGCDMGHTATEWQRSLFPEHWRQHIQVLHEGIDTDEVQPDPHASFTLPDGRVLTAKDEVVSYVARNLEPYRGFHYLMRALPEVLSTRPHVQVVLVGGDGVSYGDLPPYGGNWRTLLLGEFAGRVDTSRLHFVGRVPRGEYLRLLQISSLHVYFSYPFVLSWSCLEALAAGCLVLAGDVASIREVVRDGQNGRLVDMRDSAKVATAMLELLAVGNASELVRTQARSDMVEKFDLRTRCLPRWMQTVADLVSA